MSAYFKTLSTGKFVLKENYINKNLKVNDKEEATPVDDESQSKR